MSDLLLYHLFVEGAQFIEGLRCGEDLTMANGDDSTTLCSNGVTPDFQLGPGNPPPPPPALGIPAFKTTDIGACNGVVHGLSNVMLPGDEA